MHFYLHLYYYKIHVADTFTCISIYMHVVEAFTSIYIWTKTSSMFQMQDLPQAILAALASATKPISSLDLASKLACDVQKVVGAVKSLEVLEGYIETEMVAAKR